MSALSRAMTQMGNLEYCAKSTSNTESNVNFSPSLKNMSKHGNCAVKEQHLLLMNFFYSGDGMAEWFRVLDLKPRDQWFKLSTLLVHGFKSSDAL